MIEAERLLSALADRERLLQKEKISSGHANTLLAAMDVLHRSEFPDEGLRYVLEICQHATGADMGLLLSFDGTEGVRIRASTRCDIDAQELKICSSSFLQPRRFANLRDAGLYDTLVEKTGFLSLLSAPVAVPEDEHMALTLWSSQAGHFSRFDLELLQRIASLLEQTLDRLRLAHYNSILARIIDNGGDQSAPSLFPETSFDVLSRAYERVVEWQDQIITITNQLLADRSGSVDQAIDLALARTGELAGSDRTYVFRLRPPDRLDNTHEWVAAGIEPMIHQLQDMPDDIMAEWRPDLDSGLPVHIPNVDALSDGSAVKEVLQMQGILSLLAVPMTKNGQLTGFMGFDAVRARRTFTPVEIQLLKSVANAIGVVLDRTAAETKAQNAISNLIQERNRTEATLAAIPYLVVEFDADGRFESYRSTGDFEPILRPEDAVGQIPEDVLPPNLAALARLMMEQADQAGHSEQHEYSIDRDGQTLWFEASATAKRDSDLGTGGYVFVVQDITMRRQQQLQIRRLSRIAELTSNLVIVTDVEGRVDWVNPAFERHTGWKLNEIRGQKPGDFLQNERTDPVIVDRVRAALRDKRPIQAQLLNVSRSGAEYWVNKDIQTLYDESGRLEGFVSIQTDITALQTSHQREMRVRAQAMESSSDGIAITDSEGGFVYMNAEYRRIFDVTSHGQIKTLKWQDLATTHGETKMSTEILPRLRAEKKWRGHLKGIRRNGEVIDQDLTLSLTEDGGVLCITRDITQQRIMEAEHARLREELQVAQRRETVAQLASGVAHDLNNLLAVVSGSVTLLEPYGLENEEIHIGLDRIARAMDATRDLVDSLGDISKPNSPKCILDLRDTIVDAVNLLGTERIDKHAVDIALPEAAMPVLANRTALLQVILNLALNACESGDNATVQVLAGSNAEQHVQLAPDIGHLYADELYEYFAVLDTGDGIDPSVRDRLFEPYMTTKGDAGTGMGLPIVAGILKEIGGALWVDSQLGKGSIFVVAWPATRTEFLEKQTSHDTDVTPNVDLSGRRVCVVDDNSDIAHIVSGMLAKDGAICTVFSDPEHAPKHIETEPGRYSVIVTDLDMPGASGVDLARIARRQDPPLPCVLVTAKPATLGGNGNLFHSVLTKPVNECSLVRAVRAAVSSRSEDS
ncbi:PAS domain S-box protein [Maritalea mobilis]|uniref:PAS domain S-box protein n=1 Tax=Maritalea mobilis TaxID=483324 RepID=UPI001C96F0FA|nr:PAS domain S-box protein [Maritalea mobilis]MBY6201029.1 PAS domain S-box protein [Maritalea mobilis]